MSQVEEVMIEDLSRGGSGVARDSQGCIVFVPYTAPGDRVLIRKIPTQKRNYAQGDVLEWLELSSQRVPARCVGFGRCGGCQWQHLPYELQWTTKIKGLKHTFTRMQMALPESWEEIPAQQIWEYRNRVQLRGQGENLGFFQAQSCKLVPLNRCEIAHPQINASWEGVRQEGARRKRPFKVELEVLASGELRKVWNARHAALGFRQIHDEQNEKLKSWIYSLLYQKSSILDLFGGSGNLSQKLVQTAKEIHCVDLGAPKSTQVGPRFFHRSPVVDWLKGFQGQAMAAILDPPRQGLARSFNEIAHLLESKGVVQVIAVGCDVDAWMGDLNRWIKRGWKLHQVLAIDFFPHTPHLEVVAHLTLEASQNLKK